MDLALIRAIEKKSCDFDGLSTADRLAIEKQFVKSPSDRATVKKVLKIFDDMFVDSRERTQLVKLLRLRGTALRQLNGILGTTGGRILRRHEGYYYNHVKQFTVDEIAPATALIKNKHGDEYTKADAVRHLSKIRHPRAIQGIVAALEGPLYAYSAARVTLIKMKDPKAIPYLVAGLRSKDVKVRQSIILILAKIKDPRVAPIIASALKDQDETVRLTAVSYLEDLKDSRTVPALIAALKDPSIAYHTISALRKIKDARVVPALIAFLKNSGKASNADLNWAARVLGIIGNKKAVPALIAALSHADFYVREGAAIALSNMPHPSAIPALSKAFKDASARKVVMRQGADSFRRAVAQALGNSKSIKATPTLLAALKDPEERVREAAAAALGTLKNPLAVPALLTALKDRNLYVRWKAVVALAELKQMQNVQVQRALLRELKTINKEYHLYEPWLSYIGYYKVLSGKVYNTYMELPLSALKFVIKHGDAKMKDAARTTLCISESSTYCTDIYLSLEKQGLLP